MKFPTPANGAVPPIAETATVAFPPLQRIGALTEALALSTLGCVIVTLALEVHPLASLTTTE